MKKYFAAVLAMLMVLSLVPVCFAAGGYTVICTDENGDPVQGAKIQICDSNSCSVKVTDADGKAVFANIPHGEWEVHVLKAPAGYVKPEETEMTSSDGSDVFFTIYTEAGAADAAAQADAGIPADGSDADAVAPVFTSLDDINFADYSLVMVNYWEPWCSPCVGEIPTLETLYKEYKDQGFLLVGMYHTEDGAEETLEGLGGVTYPVIRYTDEGELPGPGYVPATVFYDSQGNVLQPTEEEIINGIIYSYREEAETFDPADYPDEDPEVVEAYRVFLDTLKDEETLRKAAEESSAEYIEFLKEYPDQFIGSANYDGWKERIENRLNG